MDLKIEKSEADFSRTRVSHHSSKVYFDYRACKGRWDRHFCGVYTNTSNGSGCSLPLQASSRMAIQNKTNSESNELLIFITPRIIKTDQTDL